MKLNLIESFLKVCELNSVTRAAEALDISKGRLSQQIKFFEQELGLTLFSRSNKGIQLNDTGQLIYQQTLRITHAVDDLITTASLIKSTPEGMLSLYSGYCYAKLYLLPHLNYFKSLYPKMNIKLDLTEGLPNLTGGKPQIVFGVNASIDVPQNWKQKKLTSSRFIFCCSANYFAKHGHVRLIDDLVDHQFIAHSSYVQNGLLNIDLRSGNALTLKPSIVLNNTSAMLDLALDAQGVIMAHEDMVSQFIHTSELIEILPNQLAHKYNDIYLYYPEGSEKHPNIRIFIDHFAKLYNIA
ncbi:LysR family transcriptional regulator [Fangia hongkongensis]|uniref:LysR family transcriptional regulator n=1 Tax=Fangia hongkongensis TaxID=270495 RepID=UPI00035DBE8F|nr:LysR family transcriptional regulator [Fangia hongkongensis]MBK2125721.1 LysR family transcriptional regulator [Fangia hongkongensis]